MIETNDTDVVVIAVSNLQDIPARELCVAFGVGKHLRYLAIHNIVQQLGPQVAKALAMFHAITGCDVSFFVGKGKMSAWDTWKVYPAAIDAFLDLGAMPNRVTDARMSVIERFVVILYYRTSVLNQVNEARQDLFSKQSRTLENIPPTQAALLQHTMHACYQAGHIWRQALTSQPTLPSPVEWGWEKDGQSWKPFWTTLPQVKETCYELIHCGCKKGCRAQCKCCKASLSCTALCSCGGNCQ